MADWDVVSHEPSPKDAWAVKSHEPAPDSLSIGGAIDAARAIPGGLAQGAASLLGLFGSAEDLFGKGMGAVGIPVRTREEINADSAKGIGPPNTLPPNISDLNKAFSAPTGGYYQPKTPVGRIAETAASFAPALIGGEASIPSKILTRLVAPATGSEIAGQATQGTPLEPYARVAGALAGGGLAAGLKSGVRAAVSTPPSPENVAPKFVAQLASKAGITPDAMSATGAANQGRGMMGAEAMGPSGIATLAALGRRSGATGEALGTSLAARAQGAPDRMLADFAQASGIDPKAAQGNFDSVLEAGQKRAAPLYKGAQDANQSVSSPEIDRILATPAGRKAMRQASELMQNDQSLMGISDPDLLEQAHEAGQEIPWKGGVAAGLKLRSLDYVKRALDDQIGSAFRAGNKTEGGILTGLKNRLVSALDAADITAKAGPNSLKPEGGMYAQARAAAGDYLQAKQAFEDGTGDILSPSVSVADFQKKLSGLSPTAAESYKGGIANKLFLQAQNGRLNPKFVNVPAVQQKLAAALGPNAAMNFISNINKEFALAKSGARMAPGTNSITSDIGLASNEMDQYGNIMGGVQAARAGGHLLSGNIPGAAMGALSAARHFAPDMFKTGGMSPEIRDAVGKLMMLSPQELSDIIRQAGVQPPPPTMAGRLVPFSIPATSIYGQQQ